MEQMERGIETRLEITMDSKIYSATSRVSNEVCNLRYHVKQAMEDLKWAMKEEMDKLKNEIAELKNEIRILKQK